ncbi:hypothetical protein [Aureispira sp. CCB-E]|uniref:hypothetical protein n=1 Tax=Aureispira sp. CCB-E TaxID=3051121 RepID=UPI0028697725|nr:hypothetical protein [Aureispira sp. CCB-E]WMX12387.1 hypothetical protein QP953_16280 [Aureispira sp. CCB-E]
MKLGIKRKKISEANIQAEFYHQCRLYKIPFYLEFKYENSRFDGVVFDTKTHEILIIVEFKSKVKSKKEYNTLQIKKYKKYNLPIIVIDKVSQIEEGIIKIFRILWQTSVTEEEKENIVSKVNEYKNKKDTTLAQLESSLISRFLYKKEMDKVNKIKL